MSVIQPLAKIVIIEDDLEVMELEKYHLEKAGYEVLSFHSTRHVESVLEDVDLMIVDRKLPGIEGSDFIRYLRDQGVEIPVIFVSAKARDAEIEEGFLRGGDDYIRKPFNYKELLYRVKAILKRTKGLTQERIEYRDIVVDQQERKVYVDAQEVVLTRREYDLLLFFLNNRQKIVDRDTLLQNVWNNETNIQKRTINVALNRLRKKIDPKGEKIYIVPIHGIGYKLL